MIKKKILLLALILFTYSCGYNPIYLNKENNFSIFSITIEDKKKNNL